MLQSEYTTLFPLGERVNSSDSLNPETQVLALRSEHTSPRAATDSSELDVTAQAALEGTFEVLLAEGPALHDQPHQL